MKVSVVMITYAHAPFIVEAIEGVLMQKCDFEIELILANDCSPDNTDEVVKSYLDNHPQKGLVKYTRHENNKGMMGNFIWALEQCKGKYIALCEGDDYWTDPLKLKRQVDFLETNEDVVMTFGNARVLDLTDNYRKKDFYITDIVSKKISSCDALSLGLPTLTMVFRNNIEFPKWIINVMSGDFFLRLVLSRYGNFYCHDEIFGVYRKNSNGVSRTNNRIVWNLNTVKYLELALKDENTLACQKSVISKLVSKHLLYTFFGMLLSKDKNAINVLGKVLCTKGFYTRQGLGTLKFLFFEILVKRNSRSLDIF